MTTLQGPSSQQKNEVEEALHDLALLSLRAAGAVDEVSSDTNALLNAVLQRVQTLCHADHAALALPTRDALHAAHLHEENSVVASMQASLRAGAEIEYVIGEPIEALLADGSEQAAIPSVLTYPLPLSAHAEKTSGERPAQALLILGWGMRIDEPAREHAKATIRMIAPAAGAAIALCLLVDRIPRGEAHRTDAHGGPELHPREHEEWQQVFYAVSDPMCVLTPDFRIVRANDAYTRLFGLDASRMAGQYCYVATCGRESPCDDCPLPHTLVGAETISGHRAVYLPSGPDGASERHLFEVWTYPVRKATGEVAWVVEILKDVSEREQLRQAQTQAEILREADRLKAELLGTVSHELRSPLAAIKGYAATLRRHHRRLSLAERNRFLEAIDSASDRLSRIIERLLEVSQLETGDVLLDVAPVDLARAAQSALAAAEADASRGDSPRHTFTLQVADAAPRPDGSPLFVFGDARLLRQVVDDLLENAVKYSPDGGTIEVVLSAVPLSPARVPASVTAHKSIRDMDEGRSSDGRAYAEMIVRDGGIGIPPDHLGRIFDTFHRVDTSLTREVDGLGLGLALCRRVVELHGGSIWAESELGRGSAFHVLLPCVEGAAGLE
jgi:PAS domain S-box-containing protein